MTDDAISLNATDIMRLLPHRFPFLLIDKITTCIPGKSLTAIKNVSINEPFFQGHFPGKPIFPGVLIIEAMAQAGGVLSHITAGDVEPKPLYYLVGVDNAKFRHPVYAGDQLEVVVEVERIVRGMWRYACTASVDGKKVVTARILCAPGRRI